MARNQANVYLTIWNDPDFLTLSPNAKLLYFTLLTHPTLTYCGIADWREKRLATMCGGLTIEALRQAAWELGQVRLIAVDPDTEEVLVRSFVRHDGVLKSPNTTKGMVREYGTIMSLRLRELVTLETRRAVEEHPDWKGVPEVGPVTKQFPNSTGNPSPNPSGNPSEMVPDWFRLGGSNPSPNPSGNPSELVPPPLTSTSTPSKEGRGDASAEASSPPKEEKRGSRIQAGWMPPQDLIETIHAEYPALDLKSEHANFVDYWLALPGQKALKVDWPATWRRWMRRQGKEQAEKQSRGYRTQNQIMADERARAAHQTNAMEGNALNLIAGGNQ